ncbi:MAG: slipin family protein [Planctomycetaceae bacterium]|nr:slipin family protein [Planctomycetaceae bacterium]
MHRTVRHYERGLLYEKGRFIRVLEPGRYSWWFWQHKAVDVVDLRETSQTVEGQEILSSDRIGVRITLIAQYRVQDIIAAVHNVEDYVSQLYQDLQLTLRENVSSRTLEALLSDRESLSEEIRSAVAPRAQKYGLELSRVGVKDVILPGSVRSVYLQEVEADLKGRASLVAARHEVAAARARANAARLYRDNPGLLRLQELELISELASKSGNVVVIPGLDRLFSSAPEAVRAGGGQSSSSTQTPAEDTADDAGSAS